MLHLQSFTFLRWKCKQSFSKPWTTIAILCKSKTYVNKYETENNARDFER